VDLGRGLTTHGCLSDAVVDSPSTELVVLEVVVQFSLELENPVVSPFDFPPLTMPVVLSSTSLDISYTSDEPFSAPISTVVGFGSFGTSPPYKSNFDGACLAP